MVCSRMYLLGHSIYWSDNSGDTLEYSYSRCSVLLRQEQQASTRLVDESQVVWTIPARMGREAHLPHKGQVVHAVDHGHIIVDNIGHYTKRLGSAGHRSSYGSSGLVGLEISGIRSRMAS